jgi:hypothetical protein
MFWVGVVVVVALVLLAARWYDRKHHNPKGVPGAGPSQGEVLDQESARGLGTFHNHQP